MSSLVLKAIKIQLKVVIPIVRELEKEIVKERTQSRMEGVAHFDFRWRKGTQSE